MRALLFLAVVTGNVLALTGMSLAADGPQRDDLSAHTVLTDDAGQSGVDHRLLECRIDPRLLHTVWNGQVSSQPKPHVCTGGANRLGAGYVRYLATSRMVKVHRLLRG
ncbi:hypothetical protein HKD24_07645 [Gluconobacter sp. LMG 31484]|uniref:Uncharacterized protein n=1 Tax=Gluconobacter vitians TaxID=2728102 RepID=A0ABR9Y586_9PROT|nr:hypothetical protein [Gluconobacter vitians]MBF0859088.1 hypothetical protein [Gluconobacter vitians]